MIQTLLHEVQKLHHRHELAGTVGPDYYEPGMMEYLAQSDGSYEPETGHLTIQFEAKGTRYEGRTEQIEKVRVGDAISVIRDTENSYNPNNFMLLTEKGHDVGNMPAELCNAVAPLFDAGELVFEHASVCFVEPISKRSRHAKQAVLFVRLEVRIKNNRTL